MVPALALRADRVLDDRWNGWARPLATAEALSDFLRRWRENDPNGVWGQAYELNGQLACTRSDEDEPELFPRAGATSGGVPLYDLTGWVWVELDAIDEYYGDRR